MKFKDNHNLLSDEVRLNLGMIEDKFTEIDSNLNNVTKVTSKLQDIIRKMSNTNNLDDGFYELVKGIEQKKYIKFTQVPIEHLDNNSTNTIPNKELLTNDQIEQSPVKSVNHPTIANLEHLILLLQTELRLVVIT